MKNLRIENRRVRMDRHGYAMRQSYRRKCVECNAALPDPSEWELVAVVEPMPTLARSEPVCTTCARSRDAELVKICDDLNAIGGKADEVERGLAIINSGNASFVCRHAQQIAQARQYEICAAGVSRSTFISQSVTDQNAPLLSAALHRHYSTSPPPPPPPAEPTLSPQEIAHKQRLDAAIRSIAFALDGRNGSAADRAKALLDGVFVAAGVRNP